LDIYLLAREVIKANPGIGKERLAALTGYVPNTAAKLLARYQGEIHGHSKEPAYLRLVELKGNHWNDHQTLKELVKTTHIDMDRAKRYLARFKGATERPPQLPANCNWRRYLKQPPQKLNREELYKQIRELLDENPSIGMQKLGRLVGCRTHRARLIREEIRGQMEGHLNTPEYQKFLAILKKRSPNGGKIRTIGYEALASALGTSKSKAKLMLARYKGTATKTGTTSPIKSGSSTERTTPCINRWDEINEDLRVIASKGFEIDTPDQLLRTENVDPKDWKFLKSAVKHGLDGYTEVQVTLERRVIDQHHAGLQQTLLEAFEAASANAKPITPYKHNGSGILYVPSLPDSHLGKYCWAPQSGAAYDIDIARRLLMEAVDDLLQKAAMFKPEKILFAVGNDFYNVDSLEKCTTAGTPQDEVGTWQETFIAGKSTIVEAIARCRTLAPVHVVIVSGNHDTQRAWYLGDTLQSYYRNTDGVTVDNEPRPRKYFEWGTVLLGLTHGNENRHERLPVIMAQERASAWAKSSYREWLLGHYHSRKQKWVAADDDQSGVSVRLMPSLCPSDYWHTKKGFWSRRSAEGYVYDRAKGLIAEFIHSIPRNN